VTVFSDGSVIKHSLTPLFDVDYETCAEASRQLNALLIGTNLESQIQVPSRHDHVAVLVRDAVASLHAQQPTSDGDQVFIGGSSRVADAFDGVETVRQVLSILEQELLVVSLVQDMLNRGLSVAIGSENGFEPLSACAVIVAPVTIDGSPAGAVGLLGPTRMKYQEAMAAAGAVSQHLTRHFGGDEENANH
jgi:heat-inducible transcriptional repressor